MSIEAFGKFLPMLNLSLYFKWKLVEEIAEIKCQDANTFKEKRSKVQK